MNRGKFISFFLLLNFALIKGDKEKNLTNQQRILEEQSDDIEDLDTHFESSDNTENSLNYIEKLTEKNTELIEKPTEKSLNYIEKPTEKPTEPIEKSTENSLNDNKKSFDDTEKPSDDIEKSSDDIRKDNLISHTEDIPLPDSYIFGFTNYEFFENPYMFKYDIILRIANYPTNEIDYITKKVDIVTSITEEEEVTCLKTRNMSSDIYRFACSKEVSEPVSQISYVNNSIVLNGKYPLNSSYSEIAKFLGQNIQLQTRNLFSDPEMDIIFFKNCYVYGENKKLLVEGETYGSAINSDDSTLSFVQEEDIKNIICNINDENNNKFKMVCNPNFNVNADLSNNNMVYIDDVGKNGMLFFEEGKSLGKVDIEDNSESEPKFTRKPSTSNSKKISKIIILVIIIFSILLIVIITIIIIKCKKLNDSRKKNQENNESQPPSQSIILPETSKEKPSTDNIARE